MLVTHYSQLTGAKLISDDLLSNCPDYHKWEVRTKYHYNKLHQDCSIEFRPYQYQYAALYCTRPHNICAGSPGLGKTTIAGLAIAAIYAPLSVRRPGTVHILVPSALSATTRWLQDLEKIAALHGWVEFINSEKQLLASRSPVWIYTTDFLKRKSKLLSHTSRPYISRLLKKQHIVPAFLVMDEVHNARVNSDRSHHLAYVSGFAKRRLALSGTLSDGRLDMLHFTCRLVYGQRFPFGQTEFARTFGVKKEIQTNYIGGSDEEPEVQTRYLQHLSVNRVPQYYNLATRFIHRVTLNVPEVRDCIKLPTQTDTVDFVPLCPKQQEIYQRLVVSNKQQLRQALTYSGSAANRAHAFSLLRPLIMATTCPWTFGLEGRSYKVKQVLELVREGRSQNKKTAIFTGIVEAGRYLHETISAEYGSQSVVRLYARDENAQIKTMKADERASAVMRFLYDPTVWVGVFSVQLASESIDLTSAGQVIFFDLPWSSLRIAQALARAVRPGSIHSNVSVRYVVSPGSIDEHIWNLLATKLVGAKLLLDFDVSDGITTSGSGTIAPEDIIAKLLQG